MVNLCKDCKWYTMVGAGPICNERDNVDLVTGKPIYQFCYDMRNKDNGRCGWDAKLFVAK